MRRRLLAAVLAALNWQQASVPVTLNAGWKTIRLTKGDLYAAVDYLELQ
jgi:arabinan endo-1,5-alpha-L-arabinosidase